MGKGEKVFTPHILAIPYPSQGHVNPMFQFCKRLVSKGAKATFTITKFMNKTMNLNSDTSIPINTISDGFDDGGFTEADSVEDYLSRLETVGSKTLEDLIKSYNVRNNPIDCIVYDAFLPWVLDVAKKFDIKGAPFCTQACAVFYVYYYLHHGVLRLPVRTPPPVELPGLPPLDGPDMPSYIYVYGSYPAYLEMLLNQFSNVDRADFILINTFYKLEEVAVDSMAEVLSPLLTIGPTLPSSYLDKRIKNDTKYDINLFNSDSPSPIFQWLSSKPPRSVVYIAFGSIAELPAAQMGEIAHGLDAAGFDFLWAVRDSDKEEKIPKDFISRSCNKGLFMNWIPQMEVLSNEAVGCFISHGGWNSTIEALSMGVPMVVMPQWSDQTTDAKLVQDMWGVGVRADNVDGIVQREEVQKCVREVMEGEKGKEMRANGSKWKALAKEAVSEGGTSDVNIDRFISLI